MTDTLDRAVGELQEQAMAEAREQLSETVIDHWLRPRHLGAMEGADGYASLTGPCGDTMELFLRIRAGTIVRASFLTDGCGTSIAAASMAVELSTGLSVSQASQITQARILEALGGLPEAHAHCALLAANTLRAAIVDQARTSSEPWKRIYRRDRS